MLFSSIEGRASIRQRAQEPLSWRFDLLLSNLLIYLFQEIFLVEAGSNFGEARLLHIMQHAKLIYIQLFLDMFHESWTHDPRRLELRARNRRFKLFLDNAYRLLLVLAVGATSLIRHKYR